MFKNKKILAFIPARIGSERVKNKNLRKLQKKPLFSYSINVAKQSKYIDAIIVSSDSVDIIKYAHENGCIKNELRPKALSSSKSRIVDSVLYEIKKNNLNFDILVLLQPTFPFRNSDMLDSAIELFFEHGQTSLITVTPINVNPVFCRTIENGKLKKVLSESSDLRSQDFRTYYRIVGNIYINNIKNLTTKTVFNENEIPYIIDGDACIDIDYEKDLRLARRRMKNANNNVSLRKKK